MVFHCLVHIMYGILYDTKKMYNYCTINNNLLVPSIFIFGKGFFFYFEFFVCPILEKKLLRGSALVFTQNN